MAEVYNTFRENHKLIEKSLVRKTESEGQSTYAHKGA